MSSVNALNLDQSNILSFGNGLDKWSKSAKINNLLHGFMHQTINRDTKLKFVICCFQSKRALNLFSTVNLLPNNKILDMTKLKTFAGYIFNIVKMTISHFNPFPNDKF